MDQSPYRDPEALRVRPPFVGRDVGERAKLRDALAEHALDLSHVRPHRGGETRQGISRVLTSPKALEEGAETLRPCGIGLRLLGDPAEQEARQIVPSDALAEAPCIDLLAPKPVPKIRQNDHGQMIVGKPGELSAGDACVIDEAVATSLPDDPAESVRATAPVVERHLRPHQSKAWPRQH